MAEAKKPTKKIIDVKHPGQTAPSGTSKSVIVTNRPIMKDPMVVDDEVKPEETPTAPTYKSGGEAVIKPLSDKKTDQPAESTSDKDDKPETEKSKTISELAEEANAEPKNDDKKEPEIKLPIDEEEVKDEAENAQETDDKTPGDKDEPTPAKAEKLPVEKDETPENEPHKDTTEPKLDDDKKDSNADTKDIEGIEDPEAAQEGKELKKRKAEVAKLAESKKFYLPITTVENRHNRRAVVIGVAISILLIIMWINIALDAGLINLGGIKPFTNFF